MRSGVGARRLQTCCNEGFFEDGIHYLAVLERSVWCALGHEQCSRGGNAIMPDVGGERFADIWRNRHAIMPLSLAAHEKFTGSPVNIAELDGDDLRRSQPKTGHQQRHCI